MTSLIEFLKQRLDEEELLAREAEGADLFDGTGIVVMHLHGGDTRSTTLPSHIARFAARHDPARVLAEVEAKRQIVEEHSPIQERGLWHEGTGYAAETVCAMCVYVGDDEDPGGNLRRYREHAGFPCRTLRLLAAGSYADHPEYDEAWKP